MKALSLFSGAGIGDIGFRAAGFDFVAFCELEADRLGIAKHNFPNAEFFDGDIWLLKDRIVDFVRETCARDGVGLSLISCTAPCQGMSKNGQGTLLKNARDGKRPKLDPRNRLIIPALDIIKALQPEMVVFENVTEMRRTVIENEEGELVSILELIRSTLEPLYVGKAYDIEVADYGVPQRRQRLITVYSRVPAHRTLMCQGGELVPPQTHFKTPAGRQAPWVSVATALAGFPPLDAKGPDTASSPAVEYHRVPLLDEHKYAWVSNTPPGRSAFDNQCVTCGFQDNPAHSTGRDGNGINRASRETPINCVKCGALLPRPSTVLEDGSRRIMSGFTSAYKRMQADLPAPALTRNFSYACSDQKVHPFENRVLSIAEALRIQTISEYKFEWVVDVDGQSKHAPDALIRLVIGESVPPKFLELLGSYLLSTAAGDFDFSSFEGTQHSLFAAYPDDGAERRPDLKTRLKKPSAVVAV